MKNNDPYSALNWWRTATIKEKERVLREFRNSPEKDYRKKWPLKRVMISDSTMIELYERFVGN